MLHEWQQQALQKWNNNKNIGIIEAGTGAGKTKLALAAITQLKTTTLIIVPTIDLLQQWKNELIKIGCPPNLIGQLGDSEHSLNKYTIATFNSARNYLDFNFELIIVDEIHHLPSEKNKIILDSKYKYFLGLTATFKRQDNKHQLINIPIVYKYTQEKAIEDNIIANYEIKQLMVFLNEHEEIEYNETDELIKLLFPDFDYNLAIVHKIMKIYGHPRQKDAVELIKAISKRKQIILNCEHRILKTSQLINDIGDKHKIIVFSESIKLAEEVFNLTKIENKYIYHSKLNKKQRKEIYEQFKNCETGVVISCKALEEGVDFPSCKVAIISGGTSQQRQAIQRIGRVIRKHNDETAIIYDLTVAETKDEDWFKKRYK